MAIKDMERLMIIMKLKGALMLKSSSKDDRYKIANEMAELLVYNDTSRILRYDMKRDTVRNDTIGGLRFIDGIWNEVDGEIKIFLDKASKDKDNKYVLIINDIDEVEDLSSAFDDVLSKMEHRDCLYTLNNGKCMMVSSNVYIIATVTMTRGLDEWTLERFIEVDLNDKTMYREIISTLENNQMVNSILHKYKNKESVSEMLALLLMRTLDIVYYEGRHMQQVRKTIVTDKPRGEINVRQSILCGAYYEGKMVCDVYEKTIDNRCMQMIKFAMTLLLQYDALDVMKMSEYIRLQLTARLEMLNEVSDKIYTLPMLCKRIPKCYEPVMTVCRTILGEYRSMVINNKSKKSEESCEI